jgi:hypothetical protein
MAVMAVQKAVRFTHPVWAKDYLDREHVVPGGARVDPALFARDGAVLVTINAGAATNEVQTVTITGVPTGGTFTLTYAGQTTAPIAYNAPTANVQSALTALPPIGAGNVVVGGSAGGPYTVTFQGALAGTNVNAMTAASALTGGTNPAVAVTTSTPGTTGATVLGSTAMPVDAISGPIPAGTVLHFSDGGFANTTAPAATGATSITVEALPYGILDNATAWYMGTGMVYIQSGTVLGRTYAERDAGVAFGPAVDADEEIYLLVHDIDDALTDADADLYRWGSLVDEAHLPGWTTLSATIKTYIRSKYQCMRGAS